MQQVLACLVILCPAFAYGQPVSGPTYEMKSENVRVEASGNATAINQVNAKYFMVVARDYNVPTYNVTYNTVTKQSVPSPLAKINRAVLQIRTLYSTGYSKEGDAQLAQAFRDFFSAPDLALSDNGLLSLTNLHILDGERQERMGNDEAALDAYFKPLRLLARRPALQNDYVKRIIGKPLLLRQPEGISFIMSHRCPSSPEKTCPGQMALQLKLLLKNARTNTELSNAMDAVRSFLIQTRPSSPATLSFIQYGPIMAIRLNLMADTIDRFKPILSTKAESVKLIPKLVDQIVADWNLIEPVLIFPPDNSLTSEQIVAVRFGFVLYQDIMVMNAVLGSQNKEELGDYIVKTQNLNRFLPVAQQVTGNETVSAMNECIENRLACEPGRVVWKVLPLSTGTSSPPGLAGE